MGVDKKTIESYDSHADKWSERLQSGKNVSHKYLEKPAMYSKLSEVKGKTVLCLGCGSGEECEHLNSLGVEKVIGVDMSKGLIDRAKKNYPNLEFKVMDMENLEFSKESFDLVYSSLVMHYVKDWKPALDQVLNVLKLGGIFLFSTHHPVSEGAEVTQEGKTRSSLLGYKKDKEKNTCEVIGDYLNTRLISNTWFDDLKVNYYHRPLQDIMRDIIESGFKIVDFIEPKVIDAAKKEAPLFWEIRQKIPLFMIFELKK